VAVPGVGIVQDAYGPVELERIHYVRQRYPVYVSAGRRVPQEFNVVRSGKVKVPRLRFAPELAGRADVNRNARRRARYVQGTTGQPRNEGRVPYFRATYADRGKPTADGMESLFTSDRLIALARRLFDAGVVRPYTAYANVYLPGQTLDVHTDVPAFRGAERNQVPSWLLVVMHHSGLFERWRIPVATVIGYPVACKGGAFSYHLPASCGRARKVTVTPAINSAVVLDADTIFHEVEQVAGALDLPPELVQSANLVPSDGDHWCLRSGGEGPELIAAFDTDQLRFSLSWKAYCFEDRAAEKEWSEHSDDLVLDGIVPMLVGLLIDRGTLRGPDHGLSEPEVAALLIDELIPFPPPAG
jgi:hypothetical protein